MNNFALRRRQIDFHAYVTTSPVLVISEHYFSKGKGLTRHAVYFTELFARENYFEILRANVNGKWDTLVDLIIVLTRAMSVTDFSFNMGLLDTYTSWFTLRRANFLNISFINLTF